MGYTPVILSYDVSDVQRRQGSISIAETMVKWASGATAQISSLTADINKFGMKQKFTFQRPDAVPGREDDVQVGLEMQRLAFMREQASAAMAEALQAQVGLSSQLHRGGEVDVQVGRNLAMERAQASAQVLRAQQERLRQIYQAMQLQAQSITTNCTSILVGNVIQTTCY